jgi:general secretion pathway protein N
MSIRVLVLLTGLVVTVHDEALAATAPMAVDPREQLFESKAAISEPTAGAPIGAKPGLPKLPEGSMPEPVSTGNPLWAIPLSRLTATRQRPLFAPTRLPPPVAAVAKLPPTPTAPPPKPVEPETPQLSLLGTVAGREKIGLFIDSASKTVLRLKAGENHKGWILRAVSRRQVELARGADITVLDLPPPDMNGSAALPPGMPAIAGAPPNPPFLVNTAKATGAPPMATPASAKIVVQPPTLNSPPAPVNPFQNAPRGAAR